MGTEAPAANQLPALSHTRHGFAYRPELDGIRTVAVYLVVAFHAGIHGFRGGFIGVDVFFVLSGFLVTSILLRDITGSGRVNRARFYARRARRILPAALLALTVTAIAYALVATPAERLDAVGGFRAACLYVANWFFIRQSTSYFAGNIDANPVVHFWSLAVEEQFYLVWPLLLAALCAGVRRFGRYQWWALRALVVALALASAVAAWRIGRTHLDRAYFGTDTRAYQLLLGALLACTPQLFRWVADHRRFRRALAPLALVALVVVASSRVDTSPVTRGFFAAAVTAALIVAVDGAGGGIVRRVLSLGPVTYLGQLSYGTYLWHWPVIVILARERHVNTFVLFVIACVLATALAALSFHVMERPLRSSRWLDQYRVPVIASGLALSVVVGLVVMPALLEDQRGTASVAVSTSKSSFRLLDWRVAKKDFPKLPDCLGKQASVCTVVRGTRERVLLLGDSHAHMWLPAFAEIARRESLTLSVAAMDACPWQQGLYYTNFGAFADAEKSIDRECEQRRTDWYGRLVRALGPDVVVLGQPPLEDPHFGLHLRFPDGRTLGVEDKEYHRALVDASAASLRSLASDGRTVVSLEPIPGTFPFNPLNCLSKGAAPEQCTSRVLTSPSSLERYFRSGRAGRHVYSVDLDRIVCPRLPVCDAVEHDVIVRFDANSHLTATFARMVAPEVEAALHRQGVLDNE